MKGKTMRLLAIALAAALLLSFAPAAMADTAGGVTYESGTGRTFLYDLAPVESLFSFDNVMPGDVRTAGITINNANGRDILAYLRAEPKSGTNLGLLEKLTFSVKNGAEELNATLTKGSDTWPVADPAYLDGSLYYVPLGRINSGNNVTLSLEMTVPIELGNEFQQTTGEMIWTVCIIEIEPYEPPVSPPPGPPDEPDPEIPLGPPVSVDEIPLGPYTGGDDSITGLMIACMALVALTLAGTVYFASRRKRS